ncbi:MAG TPA: FAD-binding oxidoreductase [Actinomycetota bacterium]|nr:FAD-binding oxidoreductase [Actinomycetota bacterium]
MTPTTADWGALQRAIDGDVVLPGSPEYESVRRPVMARFEHLRPAAVVLCATPADVAATLAVAGGLRLPTAIRSGGHSVAGRSSTAGIVLDVTPMRSVAFEGNVATVGAGVRLGDLYDALAEHGLTIPAGCGPSVGIACLTLGGGLGILGRKHGLTCDHLLRAQVVLADGRVVDCDEHHDGELFWALRGAGGGHFGVVTSLVFRTLPAPATTIFHLVWPLGAAATVVQAWQAWAPDAPDEVDATLRLTAAGDGERAPGAEVVGSVLDGDTDAAGLLGGLVDRVGADPVEASRRHLPHRAAKRYLEGLGSVEDRERSGPERPPPPGHLYTKSEFFRRPLPGETVAALVEHLTQGLAPGQSREVDFLPWGGAYNRVRADATAFVHRGERFLVQHLVEVGVDATPAERDAARDWLSRSWALVHPWGSGGVYPNFPDPDLQDWARAYHGTNYERLRRVKAAYDPGGFFRFHQSLPTHAPGRGGPLA